MTVPLIIVNVIPVMALQKVYKTENATEIVGVRLTPKLWRWVRDQAEQSDRTISNQIRVFLQQLKDSTNHKEKKRNG